MTSAVGEDAATRSALDALGPLLRPELSDLTAYVPHDPPGIRVKLDANEAPPARSPAIAECVARAIASTRMERYPDPRADRLREAIAKRTGARPVDLLLGTGSDEVISLVVNALARPRERAPQAVILSPTPTFVMYRITARAHGQKPVEVPLDASWDLDVATTRRAIEMMAPNVVFLATPNNPTGNRMSEDRVAAVIANASSSFVVLDEAYVDFAGASLRTMREGNPHVGVLRTLSKVGLAALRVGWLEADEALVREIDKARQPFNVSATSQMAAAAVLEDAWDALQAEVERVVGARDELAAALSGLDGFTVTPSAANFLWVRTPGAAEAVFDHLVADGILVRSFHKSGGRMASQLRITIGTSDAHEQLVASLARFEGGSR